MYIYIYICIYMFIHMYTSKPGTPRAANRGASLAPPAPTSTPRVNAGLPRS